jgi:hypothetical protein
MKCARLALMQVVGNGRTWIMSRRRGWFRRGRAGLHYALAFAAGAVGCGSDAAKSSSAGADEADSSRLAIGSLCPSCQPSAGGESSDFEGDADVCSAFARRRSVSFDEARAAGFDMPRIVRVGSESMSSPTLQDGDFIVALCCRAHRSVREELGQTLRDAPRILQEHQVIHSG